MDGVALTRPRPDFAMVFQHFGLFPWKRLDENIAYGLELRNSSKTEIAATVARYLDLMGLKDFAKSDPHQGYSLSLADSRSQEKVVGNNRGSYQSKRE